MSADGLACARRDDRAARLPRYQNIPIASIMRFMLLSFGSIRLRPFVTGFYLIIFMITFRAVLISHAFG
jgi:hypothetical protein